MIHNFNQLFLTSASLKTPERSLLSVLRLVPLYFNSKRLILAVRFIVLGLLLFLASWLYLIRKSNFISAKDLDQKIFFNCQIQDDQNNSLSQIDAEERRNAEQIRIFNLISNQINLESDFHKKNSSDVISKIYYHLVSKINYSKDCYQKVQSGGHLTDGSKLLIERMPNSKPFRLSELSFLVADHFSLYLILTVSLSGFLFIFYDLYRMIIYDAYFKNLLKADLMTNVIVLFLVTSFTSVFSAYLYTQFFTLINDKFYALLSPNSNSEKHLRLNSPFNNDYESFFYFIRISILINYFYISSLLRPGLMFMITPLGIALFLVRGFKRSDCFLIANGSVTEDKSLVSVSNLSIYNVVRITHSKNVSTTVNIKYCFSLLLALAVLSFLIISESRVNFGLSLIRQYPSYCEYLIRKYSL